MRINCAIRCEIGHLNILSLLASFARNSWHSRVKFTTQQTWIRVMGGASAGSSSLVAKCIPVFVKVRRCIYSSGYPHTTRITLSSIVVSDFLPPQVMTSLLEQAPDWFSGANISQSSDFWTRAKKTLHSRHSRDSDCLSRLCIDSICKSFAWFASFASSVNACVCVCVCVCVCGSGIPYVMGTKCPHNDGNIQNPCPCGDIFWSPWGNQLINQTKWCFLKM